MNPQPERRTTEWEELQREAAASSHDPFLGRRQFVSLCGLASCLGVASCSLFGSGDPTQEKIEAFNQLRRALEDNAADAEQNARLQLIADQLEDGLESLVMEVRASLDRLGELSSDYNASRAECVAMIEQHTALRKKLRDRVFDTQSRLKDELDEAQWDSAVGILTRGMSAARRSLLISG